MSTRTEVFAFDLGDKVIIKEIQRPGIIEGLIVDYLGPQYYVSYWDNSDRKKVYLPLRDLEAR